MLSCGVERDWRRPEVAASALAGLWSASDRGRIPKIGEEGMKPPAFAYERPTSVEAALAALARHGEDAKLLAGGQSLIPMLNLRLLAPKTIIDANRLPELDYIRVEDGALRVGALARHNAVRHSSQVAQHCPLIAEAYRFVSHHAIRNRGTIGGNLCHADPASELPVVAVLLDAIMVLKSSVGERRVPAADFFKGPYETAARPDELLTEVRFPARPEGQGYGFDEVSQRHGDFAIVAAGCTLAVEDGVCRTVRLGYGGVGPHALRVAEAEAALTGQPATPENFAKAAHAAAGHVRPTSDVHADGDYRRDLVRALTTRVLAAALARCS
jgi:CO/xanthine dehydrogenase FAD-binding subunit